MIYLDEAWITVDLLAQKLKDVTAVSICPKSKLTPMAQDYLNQHRIEVTRQVVSEVSPAPAQVVA